MDTLEHFGFFQILSFIFFLLEFLPIAFVSSILESEH